VSLHSEKIGVWCAGSAQQSTGPIFFHKTVNSHWYMNNILNPFFHQQTAEERNYGYFQKENATAHANDNSMGPIHDVFDDRIISKGLWPPRSPDLSSCDFCMWGNSKGNNPHTTEALQNEITCNCFNCRGWTSESVPELV
jgi:hypothetical protein